MVGVIDISHAARHACREVAAGLAEHHHAAACHIFAAVVARSLDDGDGPAIAHAEALTDDAVDVQLARGGAVESGVARYDILFGLEFFTATGWRQDADASAGESLTEVVVGLALQPQVQALHSEGTERLTGRTFEFDSDSAVGQSSLAIFLGNDTREHRAHSTVGILDGIVERHLFLAFDGFCCRFDDFLVLYARHLRIGPTVPVKRLICVGLMEQATEVYGAPFLHRCPVCCDVVATLHLNQLRPSDNLLQTVYANLGQILAHLLRKEGKVVHYILGTPLEMLTQLRVLRRHTHRTGIRITLAHHHAAQHDERQRAKRELVGAQHCHDDNVLRRLQLSVGLQAHLVPKTIADQRLLRLGQTNLRRDARKTHRRRRRCARTALGTTDDDEVSFRFRHTCGNGSHATLSHEFHAHSCCGVDILQVEDELCQVLDRIDVVMRRRRYE